MKKSKFAVEKNVYTIKFIPLSNLVPNKWISWFYDMISQDAPFSWGDNNRTLVTASRLADHAEAGFANQDNIEETEIEKWLTEVRKLGNTYIDLEN